MIISRKKNQKDGKWCLITWAGNYLIIDKVRKGKWIKKSKVLGLTFQTKS